MGFRFRSPKAKTGEKSEVAASNESVPAKIKVYEKSKGSEETLHV